jgi:hypothetical protein
MVASNDQGDDCEAVYSAVQVMLNCCDKNSNGLSKLRVQSIKTKAIRLADGF